DAQALPSFPTRRSSDLLVDLKPRGQSEEFAREHGPSANGMAFRVADARAAYEGAVQRGARPAEGADGGALGNGYPYVLQGIGGSLLYLVDRYGGEGPPYRGRGGGAGREGSG